jgi:hypothetical protein
MQTIVGPLMIRGGPMRTALAALSLLGCIAAFAAPAAADGMRPLRGGSAFMFAPTPPLFHGFSGQNRFIPHRFPQRQFFVNPGPVPPLNGTIVPPFSVGGTVTTIDRFHDPFFFRRHRFAFEHDRFHQFHRFHQFPGVFPVAPFVFFEEVPNQVQVFVDPNAVDEADVEDTAPEAPVIAPAKPTWRSGNSALTGTLEKPRVIIVSPAKESGSVQIFAPSAPSGHAAQVVQVPPQ